MYLLLLYARELCLPEYMYMCTPGAHGGQKRASEPLEAEVLDVCAFTFSLCMSVLPACIYVYT